MSKVYFQSQKTAIFDLKICSKHCVSVCLGHSTISNIHVFAIIRRKRIDSVAIHRYFLELILQFVDLCWNGAYLAAINSAFCVIVLRLTARCRDLRRCCLWHKASILVAPLTPPDCFLNTQLKVILYFNVYGVDGPAFDPRWGDIFRTRPDRPRGPSTLFFNGYRSLYRR
jgi:hypothetical protein